MPCRFAKSLRTLATGGHPYGSVAFAPPVHRICQKRFGTSETAVPYEKIPTVGGDLSLEELGISDNGERLMAGHPRPIRIKV